MAKALGILGALTLLLGLVSGQTLPSVLLVDQAIEIALRRHGEIEASQAAIEALQGAIKQAGYSPNPTFHVQTENWRFTGTPGFSPGRDLDIFAFVTQTIETGGKKQRRVDFAEADRHIAEMERQAVQWRIRQDVKKAYLRVLAGQRKEELLAQSRDTFSRFRGYHETRVDLGAMPEVDLIKVQLEEEKVAMTLASAEMETERAKIDLLRAMGVTGTSPGFTVRDTFTAPAVAGWANESLTDELLTAAVAHQPELLLVEAFVSRALAAVDVRRAVAKPDVTPYFGFKRTTSYNTLIGGISIPLPVRDRNTGAIEQALADVNRQEASLRAARAQVQAEVAAALAGVRRRARMLDAVENRMLPRAQTTSQITLAAYPEGGMQLLEVLDAQRSQNEVGLLHSQLLYDYQLSQIDLETAVGAAAVPVSRAGERAAN